jgi:hypothetical protein
MYRKKSDIVYGISRENSCKNTEKRRRRTKEEKKALEQ